MRKRHSRETRVQPGVKKGPGSEKGRKELIGVQDY